MAKINFAFLIHPRKIEDFYRRFPIAKVVPPSFLELLIKFLKPFVVASIKGLRNKDNQELTGYIIGVPLTATQILQLPQLALKRIIEAVNLAESLGVGIVGLGALTSSVTKGGELIKDRVNIAITTGNSLTAAITLKDIAWLIKKHGLDVNNIIISVVGATGSIGQAVCKLLLLNNLTKNLILIGRTKDHLESLGGQLKELSPSTTITKTTDLDVAKTADLVVVATSATQTILKSRHLKAGAIVYDITQPQNVSPEILKDRTDVIVIDGGLVKTPEYFKLTFQMGPPSQVTFSCLAETAILAMEGRYENFSIGKVDPKRAEEMCSLSKIYGFDNVPLNYL